MKTFHRKNYIWSLVLMAVLVGCGGGTKLVRKVDSPHNKKQGKVSSTELPESVQVRTFDQVYKTMAALTDVHPLEASASSTTNSPRSIYTEYRAIKSQLPSERNAQSFSAFNQIAATRLSFFFCNNYINKNPDLTKLNKEDYIKHLIEKFVGEDSSKFEDYAYVAETLNTVIDAESSKSYLPSVNAASIEKRYKAGCSVLLSSGYVLVLRSLL